MSKQRKMKNFQNKGFKNPKKLQFFSKKFQNFIPCYCVFMFCSFVLISTLRSPRAACSHARHFPPLNPPLFRTHQWRVSAVCCYAAKHCAVLPAMAIIIPARKCARESPGARERERERRNVKRERRTLPIRQWSRAEWAREMDDAKKREKFPVTVFLPRNSFCPSKPQQCDAMLFTFDSAWQQVAVLPWFFVKLVFAMR